FFSPIIGPYTLRLVTKRNLSGIRYQGAIRHSADREDLGAARPLSGDESTWTRPTPSTLAWSAPDSSSAGWSSASSWRPTARRNSSAGLAGDGLAPTRHSCFHTRVSP